MHRGIVIVLVVVGVLIVLSLAGAGIGMASSGRPGSMDIEDRPVSDFTVIEVHGAGTLVITQGPTASLTVKGRRAALDRLNTTVTGGTLRLDPDERWYAPWTFWRNSHLTYYVTVTDLTRIEAHGSTTIQAEQALDLDDLRLTAGGSSDVRLALNGERLSVRTSGSSDVFLSGSADTLYFSSGGSANLHALGLRTRVATVTCGGSSDVDINVSEELNVDVSGSSDVRYVGNPRLTSDISGSGDVERIE